MSTSKLALVAGALCVSLVAGCASGPNPDVTSRALDVDLIPTANAPSALLKNAPTRAVHFGFDLDTLDAEAIAELNAQAAWMLANPDVRFSVTGHADRVGSTSYNYDLGLRRATRVVDYMVSAGVAEDRLEKLVSFGEDRPIVDIQGPERLNRRVTIEVSAKQPASVVSRFSGGTSRLFFVPDDDTTRVRIGGPDNDGTSPQDPAFSIIQDDGQESLDTASGTSGGPDQEDQGGSSQSGFDQTEDTAGPTQSSSSSEDTGSATSTVTNEAAPGKSGDKPTGGPSSPPGKPDSSASASTNPSNDRLDAGRGNGSEGGDPGQSEGKNQGGDEPETEEV